MSVLKNYHEFDGRHFESGTIRNALAYQGVVTPHTGKPISEALLMGLGGGAAFGYFTFEYKGFDPQVNLLSRNTFDPFETILERLGVPQNVLQTTNPKKAEENLMEVLDSGKPAIVWADMMTLPYNGFEPNKGWWAMMPLVVYGYDGETVNIADRSAHAITMSADVFNAARARVKKDKFRIMTLGEPDLKRLNASVKKGIEQSVRLFTQPPPKGTAENFGFTGMAHWAEMLTNTRNKQSWERWLPPGRRAYVALAGTGYVPGVYQWIMTYGAGNGMERELYAEFLDEAAALLYKTKLESAAHFFRQSAELWRALAKEMLTDKEPLFKETRTLLEKRHALFIKQGDKALAEIQKIDARLRELRESSAEDFPWDDAEYAAQRAEWSKALMEICGVEEQAAKAMQAALT
jgi:hypothetical protein